jgi:hypothetical protein
MKFRMAAGLMDVEAWRRQPADDVFRHLKYFEVAERERNIRG